MNDSDDDQPAAIASAFASLKKGAARAGPAPPRTTGAYALPSIPALYANVSEATLDDAKEREKARNASLIKPNRLTQRAAFTKTWPAPNFPRLKKRLEVHVPLPRHLAWTGLRSNRYAKDDPVLRFVPYFGDDDATGIDVAAYDNEDTQAAPRPSEGLVWAAASDDVAVCTCGEDPRAITAALDAARRGPTLRKAAVALDARGLRRPCGDYATLANSYQSLFCRRCYVYDCANHGAGQPAPRRRVDPDVEILSVAPRAGSLPRGDHEVLVAKARAVFRDEAAVRRALGFAPPASKRASPVPEAPSPKRRPDRAALFRRQKLLLDRQKKRDKPSKYVCCNHEGPCDDPEVCPCAARNGFCEKYCACSWDCRARYPGCDGKKCAEGDCFMLGRECDPDVCACRGVCANSALRRNDHAQVVLGRSLVHGWGAFALQGVDKGKLVGEYRGELVSQDEADRRGKIYDKQSCSYLFDLNDELVVDATRKGAKLKFANHHPHPNLRPRVLLVDGDHRVGLYAARAIEAGDELCFNYSAEFWSAAAREASCPGAGS